MAARNSQGPNHAGSLSGGSKGPPVSPFTGANWALELVIELGGSAIGVAGLYEMDRVNSVAEIGISIGCVSERHKGAGTAAGLLLVQYTFVTLNLLV